MITTEGYVLKCLPCTEFVFQKMKIMTVKYSMSEKM